MHKQRDKDLGSIHAELAELGSLQMLEVLMQSRRGGGNDHGFTADRERSKAQAPSQIVRIHLHEDPIRFKRHQASARAHPKRKECTYPSVNRQCRFVNVSDVQITLYF